MPEKSEKVQRAAENLEGLSIALLPASAMAIGRGKKGMVKIIIDNEEICEFELSQFIQDITTVSMFVTEGKDPLSIEDASWDDPLS